MAAIDALAPIKAELEELQRRLTELETAFVDVQALKDKAAALEVSDRVKAQQMERLAQAVDALKQRIDRHFWR